MSPNRIIFVFNLSFWLLRERRFIGNNILHREHCLLFHKMAKFNVEIGSPFFFSLSYPLALHIVSERVNSTHDPVD